MDKTENEEVDEDQVWLKTTNGQYLVAIVSRTCPHVNIDLAFSVGDVVTLLCKSGKIYVSGHILIQYNGLAPSASR